MAVLRNRRRAADARRAAEIERLRTIRDRLIDRDGSLDMIFVVAYGLDRLEPEEERNDK